jgi:hypothetical protein
MKTRYREQRDVQINFRLTNKEHELVSAALEATEARFQADMIVALAKEYLAKHALQQVQQNREGACE